MKLKTFIVGATTLLLLSGCGSMKSVKSLAKTDIDTVTDTMLTTLNNQLLQLTLELYRLNPQELKKIKGIDLQARTVQIMEYPNSIAYKELDDKQDIEAVELAFDDSYRGDRVFALMIGIAGMIDNAYENRKESFILDSLDPQKLYDTATNLKIVHRMLVQQDQGDRLLATGKAKSTNGVYALLNKVAILQETSAYIVAESTGRIINKTLRGIAGALLPIGV